MPQGGEKSGGKASAKHHISCERGVRIHLRGYLRRHLRGDLREHLRGTTSGHTSLDRSTPRVRTPKPAPARPHMLSGQWLAGPPAHPRVQISPNLVPGVGKGRDWVRGLAGEVLGIWVDMGHWGRSCISFLVGWWVGALSE